MFGSQFWRYADARHGRWALGQWERAHACFVRFWTCRTALEAALAVQQSCGGHPLQVGRSRNPKIYRALDGRKQGDGRHQYVGRQHNLSADFCIPSRLPTALRVTYRFL